MKRLLIIILFALLSAIVLTGCATRRQLQVAERISHDTLYLSNAHYDSIYISQDKYIDRSRDTLLIKDKVVEYRYRLLRDTLYRTRIDSIPVVKTVVETKVERHVPAIYRLSLSILIILTLSLIIYIVWKIHI